MDAIERVIVAGVAPLRYCLKSSSAGCHSNCCCRCCRDRIVDAWERLLDAVATVIVEGVTVTVLLLESVQVDAIATVIIAGVAGDGIARRAQLNAMVIVVAGCCP